VQEENNKKIEPLEKSIFGLKGLIDFVRQNLTKFEEIKKSLSNI
jgi:uncharacterized protein YeeX (DUF496 family)